jgi:hypothetical protein
MSARFARFAVAAGTLMIVGACGDTGGIVGFSSIEVTPKNRTMEVEITSVEPGETKPISFTIINTGKGKALCIKGFDLAYTPPNGPEDPLAVTVSAPSTPVCVAPQGEGASMGLAEQAKVTVNFTRIDDAAIREATLTIQSDNTDPKLQSYDIHFTTKQCSPTLDVPPTVDFKSVTKENPVVEEVLPLSNPGSCALVVDWFMIEGDPSFTVIVNGAEYSSDKDKGEIHLDPKLEIGSLSGADWGVRFTAVSGDPAQAVVTIHSNDSNAPAGSVVKLLANTSGPRIEVVPGKAEFGGKKIGTTGKMDVLIKSIGTGAVTVKSIGQAIDWTVDPSQPNALFGLEATKLTTGKLPAKDDPSSWITIPVGSAETLVISYTPGPVKNPIDPVTGQVIKDLTWLRIENDSFTSPLDIEASGFGVEVECPIPVIVTEEGEDVPPQTVLHLHGDQSQPATGSIESYHWSVTQPDTNKFNLVPSASFPNPTHEMNVGGEYTYCLDVCDGAYCSNDPKCHTTACKKVIVLPDKAIHCELTWDTPGDLNQFDEGPDAGADMDLHFAHPFATGPDLDGDGKPDGWFDIPYDCFWFNPEPDWESMNPNAHDDPSLDRDDTDGAGPENVNLDAPVKGRTYRVGVHYWDDHGYGFSYARVKCYVWGQQVLDINQKDLGVKMFRCDMWEVATISWDSGAVAQVKNPDGSLKITHKYQNPAFVQIGGGTCE